MRELLPRSKSTRLCISSPYYRHERWSWLRFVTEVFSPSFFSGHNVGPHTEVQASIQWPHGQGSPSSAVCFARQEQAMSTEHCSRRRHRRTMMFCPKHKRTLPNAFLGLKRIVISGLISREHFLSCSHAREEHNRGLPQLEVSWLS